MTKDIRTAVIITTIVASLAGANLVVALRHAGDTERARIAAMTPGQRAAEKAAKDALAERTSARYACEVFVKRSLDDPDSAQFDDANTFPVREIKPHMYRVQVGLRARNGFNALRYARMNCYTSPAGGRWVALPIQQIE